MLLDIRKLFSSYNAPIKQNVVIDLQDEDFPGFWVKQPVSTELYLMLSGSAMQLIVSADAVVEAECARCLDKVERVFAVKREYTIKEEDSLSDDAELPFTPDGKLDVKELIYQEILLLVPTVLLCSDECQGLCPVCGKKKAEGCTCAVDTTDDRLSILKQLLS
ncbi:MAG: DUF177 domain-containing protein [Oscillospiraceae bacterium]